MNAPEIKTLADPSFQSIFNNAVVEPYDEEAVRQALINHGEKLMNAEIKCGTGENEHNHTFTPESLGHQSSSVDSVSTTIQGVSGQNYVPMDTSPKPPPSRLDQLTELLNETLKQMVIELSKQADAQTNLEEAVSTTLEQAEWFDGRISSYLDEKVEAYVDDKDFEYEIGNAVERYMRNEFDANDHYDFDTAVKGFVEDEVESIIDNLVEEAVEARLADLLEEKLANARITINF